MGQAWRGRTDAGRIILDAAHWPNTDRGAAGEQHRPIETIQALLPAMASRDGYLLPTGEALQRPARIPIFNPEC